MSLPSI